jgi:hypothetical protein
MHFSGILYTVLVTVTAHRLEMYSRTLTGGSTKAKVTVILGREPIYHYLALDVHLLKVDAFVTVYV